MIIPGALFFAPLDGITDAIFRQLILTLYPEWDFVVTDFFRVPRQGIINPQRLINHLGTPIFYRSDWKSKTIFQIITGPLDQYVSLAQQLADLAIPWLDLNLGCPSRLVNSCGAGAALLGAPKELITILRSLRKNYPHFLSVKMRVGIDDHHQLPALIKIIQGEGIDAIFLHARTRNQHYHGLANWEHIQQAVDIAQIPIVGNGDIWDFAALTRLYQQTNCHGAMLGRGALKTPWFPQRIAESRRCEQVKNYYHHLEILLREKESPEIRILHRFKSLARYLVDDLANGAEIKKNLLRSPMLGQFKNLLAMLAEDSA